LKFVIDAGNLVNKPAGVNGSHFAGLQVSKTVTTGIGIKHDGSGKILCALLPSLASLGMREMAIMQLSCNAVVLKFFIRIMVRLTKGVKIRPLAKT